MKGQIRKLSESRQPQRLYDLSADEAKADSGPPPVRTQLRTRSIGLKGLAEDPVGQRESNDAARATCFLAAAI